MDGDGTTGFLEPAEEDAVLRHARAWFPALAPSGAAGFDDLPFLHRAAARRWYGRTVEGARSFSSSGTSGHPKRIPWTAEEDAWYVREKRDLFAPWVAGCTRAFVSLAVGHNAGSAGKLLDGLGFQIHDAGLTSLDDQCTAIGALAPEVLYCSPSILESLVAALDARGRRPRSVRRIITNGEVLFAAARARAASFFGVGDSDVMDTYGSTEIGTIAHTCGRCGAFHVLDGLFPEPTPTELAGGDDQLGAAPAATVLAVSSVKRTSFPVVRFVTYDVVQGLRRSVCGGARRFTFDRVLGRCDDVLNYGELFSAYDLGDLIASCLPAARWFAFNPHNDLTIVVEGSEPPGFGEALRDRYPLHSRMIDLGLLDAPVIHFVADFDRFVARAGLPTSRHGKAARRVLRSAPEPSWFEEPTA